MPNYDYEKDIVPFLERCWKNGLNKDLLDEYKHIFSTPLKVDSTTKTMLSCPHCFLFGPNYRPGEENGGVFIIGQETHGCGCEEIGGNYGSFENYKLNPQSLKCREELMMETQTKYLFTDLEKGDRDFLKVLRTIAGVKTGKEFLEANFIWDELIAMDYNGGSFKNAPRNDHEEIKNRSKDKLTTELRLAKPKYAIFLIGYYDKELTEFLKLSSVNKIGDKLILTEEEKHPEKSRPRVISKNLINEFWLDKGKIHCFATSHPNRRTTPLEIRGKPIEYIYWDDVIAKKVWKFLAQEVKK